MSGVSPPFFKFAFSHTIYYYKGNGVKCAIMKLISRSILIMFIFDLITISVSSIFWYDRLGLPDDLLNLSVMLIVLTGLISLYLKGNYRIREFNLTLKNTYLLFEGVVFAHIPTAFLLLLFSENTKTFSFLLMNLLTVFVILRIYRALFHIYLFKFKKVKNVLIIGTNANAKLIADEITNKKALRMKVVGFVNDMENEEEYVQTQKTKIFGQETELKDIIQKYDIAIVIIAIQHRMKETFLTQMVEAIPRKVKVFKMAEFYEKVTKKYFVSKMSINWLFYDYMNRRSVVYDVCKRIMDIVCATVIFTVTLPILAYVAIRVKLTDGESPIYTQDRVGTNGKVFKMYKLRTMYANNYTPKNHGIEHTENQDKDNRVIPFCKFVRKARFDEIPQMINILKGDMSIVGPRTEWKDLVDIYSKDIPYYACRQWCKLGWTGWAQINQGHCVVNDDIAEKLQYDLYYIKHRNILWEAAILIKAVFLALGGRHD